MMMTTEMVLTQQRERFQIKGDSLGTTQGQARQERSQYLAVKTTFILTKINFFVVGFREGVQKK